MAEYDRFMDVAGDDPALAKLVQEGLRRLADGAGGSVIQEMAREVLAGRVDLREAVMSDAYADAFQDSVQRFMRWREEVGPEEQARVATRAEQHAADLRAELSENDPLES